MDKMVMEVDGRMYSLATGNCGDCDLSNDCEHEDFCGGIEQHLGRSSFCFKDVTVKPKWDGKYPVVLMRPVKKESRANVAIFTDREEGILSPYVEGEKPYICSSIVDADMENHWTYLHEETKQVRKMLGGLYG